MTALDNVSLTVMEGETMCIVGESGSGKTTLAKTIVGLVKPTSGRIIYDDIEITGGELDRETLRRVRREIQMIFQDPYDSLPPHMRVRDILLEPLEIHEKKLDREEKIRRVKESLEEVELTPAEAFLEKYPSQLSGGQRQRVAIASAIILRPRLIVADEPVSMLDVSIRMEILKLFKELGRRYNLTYIFITHDLAVAKQVGDRVAVMYLGKIMEMGEMHKVLEKPLNPYTKALIQAVPKPNPRKRGRRTLLRGETPSPVKLPTGCRFHPRCPMAEEVCRVEEPELAEVENGRLSACHFASKVPETPY